MKVTILNKTDNPMQLISRAAGTCYGKSNYSAKRIKTCLQAGHLSVFEHASVTFEIDGISRACSHQLVRHRLASFSQCSQRYCKIDVSSDDWYVMSKSFDNLTDADNEHFYRQRMKYYARFYQDALDAGIKPEDARYLLPEATKTKIVVTMNLRELFHFFDTRNSNRAQWEIRDVAYTMHNVLIGSDDEWRELITMYDETRA